MVGRRAASVLIILQALAVAATVPVQAADVGDGTPLLSDAENDVAINTDGQFVALPAGAGSQGEMDLAALSLAETQHDLSFFLKMHAANDNLVSGAWCFVYFNLTGTQYRIYLPNWLSVGTLRKYDAPSADYAYIDEVPLQLDVTTGVYNLTVPRTDLVSAQGTLPGQGDVLDGLFAECFMYGSGPGGLHDRMPDQGTGRVPYIIRSGLAQTGTARLSSTAPFRVSNGEESVFVFAANATNLADHDDTFVLSATGIPSQWDVRVPSRPLQIAAHETIPIQVPARSSFSHVHGGQASFVLSLQSVQDASSVGRLELGLRFANPPQPAGHHDTLFLHSQVDASGNEVVDRSPAYAGSHGYLNTLEDDASDQGADVQPHGCPDDTDPVPGPFCWTVVLTPGLFLGIDEDLGRLGAAVIPIRAGAPVQGATLSGQVMMRTPLEYDDRIGTTYDRVPLARFTTEPTDLAANAVAVLQAQVEPLPEGDFVQERPQSTLELTLRLEGTVLVPVGSVWQGTPAPEPYLAPGGSLQLPLIDYSDPHAAGQATGTLHAQLVGEATRRVPPGGATRFVVELHNAGQDTVRLKLGVLSTAGDWVSSPSEEFPLKAGQSVEKAVVVRVPADGQAGRLVGIAISAESVSDFSTGASVQANVVVDPSAPAEAGLDGASAGKDSPAPALALLPLLALAALAMRRQGGRR